MNDIYINLIISTIIENFGTEEAFYQDRLGVSSAAWEDWKKGFSTLSAEEMQKIKNLFSDYEWMLLQKVLRQTIIYPEKRTIAVTEFRRMKTKIARKWLNSGIGTVEILDTQEENEIGKSLDLRVTIDYKEWGYDDILNFRLPAYVQQQINNEQVALLDWVNNKLEETYNS